MPKRIFLLTGAPGVGKTTVLFKTVEALKVAGIAVGGMISREVREAGVRVGFEIVDLGNGEHGWLAQVNRQTGPQVGRYRVNLVDLEEVGVKAIAKATESCEVIAVDEIGPMELFSQQFKQTVKSALDYAKIVVAVVHAKAHDALIEQAKKRDDAELFSVTTANREMLVKQLTEKILDATQSTA